MIIRFTMNDNDYTQLLELFLNKSLICRIYSYTDYLKQNLDIKKIGEAKYYKEWKEITLVRDNFEKLMVKCRDNEIDKDEKKQFLRILKDIFLYFTKTVGKDYDYNYIKRNIRIQLKNQISDEWQNGEVIYYFISNEKYITL